ncbi:MAG: hypothetical protein IPN17_34110 [Deltaproteobacteria bacterium]|nr:hypothetical protein [Deltaproteobacteria bacterium]
MRADTAPLRPRPARPARRAASSAAPSSSERWERAAARSLVTSTAPVGSVTRHWRHPRPVVRQPSAAEGRSDASPPTKRPPR